MKNKGQAETIGLVIIVVLIVIIGLFILKASLIPDEDSFENEYLSLKANSLRETILESSLCDIQVKDEIANCQKGYTSCLKDCKELETFIFKVINNSIEKNIDYYFTASGQDFNMKLGKECKNSVSSSLQPIALTDIKVKIDVCRHFL